MRALASSYAGRKQKKRQFRQLWIARINAAARMNGLSYSKMMHGLKVANIDINRKMLAELAVNDAEGFTALAEIAKKAIVEGDYNGLVKKLVLCYEHVCNKKPILNETSADAGGEASTIDEGIITIVNGNRRRTIKVKDSIGDSLFDLQYGLESVRFRDGKIGK